MRLATGWLASALASRRPSSGDWVGVIAALGLRIAAPAPQGDTAPFPAGRDPNPIRRFGRGLLERLGAPVTAGNLDAIGAWAAGEGSCAAFNPLNTTQPEAGATPFNTLAAGGHVWNYPAFETGVVATAETLLNGLYQPILAALRGDGGLGAVAGAVITSPWGTRIFGSPSYPGAACGPAPPVTGRPAPVTVAGPDAIPATIVVRAARYQAIWAQSGGAAVGSDAAVGAEPSGGHGLPVDPGWYRAHPAWFQGQHHDYPAVDIPVPAQAPVYAVVAGRVVAADEGGGSTTCGHDVRLLGQDGALYTYCHGSQVAVSAGQSVSLGQRIMSSGWSGAVVPAGPAGAHLHFQIDLPGRSGPVCPQPALVAWARGQAFDPHDLPDQGCVAGHLP